MQAPRAQEAELTLCENCFYYHRTEERVRCDHEGSKVYVTWNEEKRRYETTARSIRPFPENLQEGIRRFAMCDPYKGTCRKDRCTFAHGIPELKAWNTILLERSIEAEPMKEVNGDMPPVNWPNLGQQSHQKPPSKAAPYAVSLEERLKHKLDPAVIIANFNPENYKQKFRHLICLEEKRHIEILGKKCDQVCNLVLFQPGRHPNWIRPALNCPSPARYGYLENLNADQIAYATQASEAAFIVPDDESLPKIELEILKENFEHSEARMYVAIEEANLINIISKPGQLNINNIAIEFEVKHLYFNWLVNNVNAVPYGIIKRILPIQQSFLQLHNISNEYVNSLLPTTTIEIDHNDQWKALCAILSVDRTSPPLLINGSFGTGKTQVLAVATYCLIRHGQKSRQPVRILISAHHQASADHFIEKYFGPMFENVKGVTLIRVYSSLYHRKKSRYSKLYVGKNEMADYNHANIPQLLIVVTTFLTASFLQKKGCKNIFTHVMVDEGSQSREPEAIGPFCLAGPDTKIIIAGDPCQVGPALLVLGDEARENGLKCSLLERLQTLYEQCGGLALEHMVSLNTNYRCHSEVVKIPNELLYESKIKTVHLKAYAHQRTSYPLKFICSSITEETNVEQEATILLEETKNFIASSNLKVCIATVTRTQLGIIRKLSQEQFKGLNFIRKLTTYQIQGQEFPALFLSTTEPVDSAGNTTNPTKSLCDPYVFNTVLTRSQTVVVVVGNPVALLRTECHMEKQYGRKAQCWSSFLKLCMDNKSFVIPSTTEKDELKQHEFKLSLKRLLINGVSEANIAALLTGNLAPHPPEQATQQVQQLPTTTNESANNRHKNYSPTSQPPSTNMEEIVSPSPVELTSNLTTSHQCTVNGLATQTQQSDEGAITSKNRREPYSSPASQPHPEIKLPEVLCVDHEPTPRTCMGMWPSIEGRFRVWGGANNDVFETMACLENHLSTVHTYDHYLETWSQLNTTGNKPSGFHSVACASTDHHHYTYGGFDSNSFYNDSLYQLDTSTLAWTRLPSGPTRKAGSGMIVHDNKLVLFGGDGIKMLDTIQPGSEFALSKIHTDGRGWVNELHTFDLKTEKWSSPTVSGVKPPPCSHFTLTMINDNQAVLFGGVQRGVRRSNDVYIIDLPTMNWSKMDSHEGEPSPVGRSFHAAVCLGYGSNYPQLLVTGGVNNDGETLNDMWIFDLTSGRWKQVEVAGLQFRFGHCAAAFHLNSMLAEITIFGGCSNFENVSTISADTTVLRFENKEYFSVSGVPIREWVLINVATKSQQGTSQRIREKMVKMNQTGCYSNELNAATRRQSQLLEEMTRQVITDCHQRIEIAERGRLDAENRAREAVQRADNHAMRANQAESMERQWVVKRREVHLTEEVLGKGGWGEVKVAEFRGIKVAAKSLYQNIRFNYYIHLFIREINMAARVRHPNLVQFIGACMEGEMVILTELLPTSLRKELERKGYHMSPDQLLSVSLDVARALNYLHQMQPDPIIHRDISSANVLLEPLAEGRWRAKVSDYGSVHFQQEIKTLNPGAPVYSAPEACHPDLQSPKMDIFSFGVLLVEMCTGQFPEVSARERLIASIRDREWVGLVRRCIEHQPDNRPSAVHIVDEFQRRMDNTV